MKSTIDSVYKYITDSFVINDKSSPQFQGFFIIKKYFLSNIDNSKERIGCILIAAIHMHLIIAKRYLKSHKPLNLIREAFSCNIETELVQDEIEYIMYDLANCFKSNNEFDYISAQTILPRLVKYYGVEFSLSAIKCNFLKNLREIVYK